MKVLSIFLVAIAQFSVAIEIRCTHRANSWTARGPIQECFVENVIVSSPNEEVKKMILHDYTTIKSFFIHKSPLCLFMPRGVETISWK
jgi:hypothetical protein